MTDLAEAAADRHLLILGGFHPAPDAPHLPPDTQTLILLGPTPDGFWPAVTASPEFKDGAPDPIDRWSTRVITDLAAVFDATALFPFGGPPWLPFLSWATAASGMWQSPAGLLVQAETGLMVSIRGALALPVRVGLGPNPTNPCPPCSKLCLTVCPVNALRGDWYDTDACRAHLRTPEGADCVNEGCRARRVCPVSAGANRSAAQSAYHMQRFLSG